MNQQQQQSYTKQAAKYALKKLALQLVKKYKWWAIAIISGVLIIAITIFMLLFVILTSINVPRHGSDYGLSEIGAAEIPSEFIPIYQEAADAYSIPWQLLAAVHAQETRFSTMDPMISPVGALGHFQFMPATWMGWAYPHRDRLGDIRTGIDITNLDNIRRYGGLGVDATGSGYADPFDIYDAAYTAARYLSMNGASDGRIEDALFRYNQDPNYVQEVYDRFNMYIDGFIDYGTVLLPPVANPYITSHFGYRDSEEIRRVGGSTNHGGTDFRAAIGTPIFAAEEGIATFVGSSGGYGNLVIIDHGLGMTTYYAHLSEFRVSTGERVARGQVIALSGNTGNSTGPHLHFEVRINGERQNPINYLPAEEFGWFSFAEHHDHS